MQIKVTTGDREIYSRLLETNDTMNAIIGHLMKVPLGDTFTTTVTNNGHTLTFRTRELDMGSLVRVVDGYKKKKGGDHGL